MRTGTSIRALTSAGTCFKVVFISSITVGQAAKVACRAFEKASIVQRFVKVVASKITWIVFKVNT